MLLVCHPSAILDALEVVVWHNAKCTDQWEALELAAPKQPPVVRDAISLFGMTTPCLTYLRIFHSATGMRVRHALSKGVSRSLLPEVDQFISPSSTGSATRTSGNGSMKSSGRKTANSFCRNVPRIQLSLIGVLAPRIASTIQKVSGNI